MSKEQKYPTPGLDEYLKGWDEGINDYKQELKDDILKNIEFSKTLPTAEEPYDIGLRNGLRLAMSIVLGKEGFDYEKRPK